MVVLCQQQGKTRSRRLVEQSWCRDAMLEAGLQKSISYCGAWTCMHLYIMTLSLSRSLHILKDLSRVSISGTVSVSS